MHDDLSRITTVPSSESSSMTLEAHRLGRLAAGELAALAVRWDAAVDATPGVDAFCAGSAWSFSAGLTWAREPVVAGADRAWCGLDVLRQAQGTALVPLDRQWGFATPLVGEAALAVAVLREVLAGTPGWDVVALSGQARGMPLTEALVEELGGDHDLLRGEEQHRLQADLRGGFDVWWARRSSRFRQRLRRLEAEAAGAGLTIEALPRDADPDEVIGVALAVEAEGWKGAAGTGLAPMADFYRLVLGRLQPQGGIRALVARLGGRPVGYVFGGVRARTYRGFQLAYATAAGPLGVGHLLQLAQVRAAAAEGCTLYDLGMDMPYKHRWADDDTTTFTLLVRSRR